MEEIHNPSIETLLSRYKPLLASMLSEKRVTHCIGSAFMAYELAYNINFNEQSAFKTALLHDIAKEFSFDIQREYANACPFPVPSYAFENRHRLHGFAAAGFLFASGYPFSHEELHAIAFHTIGSEQMNTVDMIVYCADKIEPGRGEAYAHYLPLWKQYCSNSKKHALPLLTLRIILDLIEKNNAEKLKCNETLEITRRLLELKDAIERTL